MHTVFKIISVERESYCNPNMEQGIEEREETLKKQVTTSHVKRTKLALAVAIIKSRPEGMSGKEYAQQLCSQYQASQLDWKARYSRLMDKMLAVQASLPPATVSAGSESSGKSAEDQNVNNNDDSASQSLLLTPPSSSENPSTNIDREDSLAAQCVQFLQALVTMKDLTVQAQTCKHTDGRDSIRLSGSDKFQSKLHEQEHKDMVEHAVIRSVEALTEWIKDPQRHLSDRMAHQVVETLGRAADSEDVHLAECTHQAAYSFIQDLIKVIMDHDNVGQISVQKRRSAILSSIATSQRLRPSVVFLCVTCITQFSNLLRQTRTGQASLQPHLFENSYHIFSSLDEAVQMEFKANDSSRTLSRDDMCILHNKLEDCLLHLTETFPLFAHYVWRITNMIGLLFPE